MRHRIGIDTLRRELDAVHAASADNSSSRNNHRHTSSSSSSNITPPSPACSSTLTNEDVWATNGYLTIPSESTANGHSYNHHGSTAVGDKIPGYRTSAGMFGQLLECELSRDTGKLCFMLRASPLDVFDNQSLSHQLVVFLFPRTHSAIIRFVLSSFAFALEAAAYASAIACRNPVQAAYL